MTTKPIAVIGALDAEIATIASHIQNLAQHQWLEFTFYEGMLFGRKIVLAKSGVGKVMAAMVTQKIIDTYHPAYILFTGVAGGLNPNYEIGDIVIARDTVQHDLDAAELGFARGQVPYTDYRFFNTHTALKETALQTQCAHKLHEGRIVTGDHFMTKKEIAHYSYLTEELQGDAVEMEGAAVGQVCTINQIPFLLIRTLSDKADGEATANFLEFLPVVADNSIHVIRAVLENHATI